MFDYDNIKIQQIGDLHTSYLQYVEKKLCHNGVVASVNEYGELAISFKPYHRYGEVYDTVSIAAQTAYICRLFHDELVLLDGNVVFVDLPLDAISIPIFMKSYDAGEMIFKLLHTIITKIPGTEFSFYFDGGYTEKVIDDICDAYKRLIDAGVTDDDLSRYSIRLQYNLHVIYGTPMPRAKVPWDSLFHKCIHYKLTHTNASGAI